MHRPLDQQAIVITGASSGIGLATATLAAERGASLMLLARSQQALQRIREELSAGGATVDIAVVDVADRDALERIAAVPQSATLVSGGAPLVWAAPTSAISAALGGMKLGCFAVGNDRIPRELIARKGIESLDDLCGKTFGVQSIGGGFWLATMAVLNGLLFFTGEDRGATGAPPDAQHRAREDAQRREVEGDASAAVSGVAPLDRATPTDVSFRGSPTGASG